MQKIIKEAADKVGGIVALSKALGLSRGAVSQWERIPVGRVVDVEKLTGISRELLRPDVFRAAAVCEPSQTQEAT